MCLCSFRSERLEHVGGYNTARDARPYYSWWHQRWRRQRPPLTAADTTCVVPPYTSHLRRQELHCWRSKSVEQFTVLVTTAHRLRTIQTATWKASVCELNDYDVIALRNTLTYLLTYLLIYRAGEFCLQVKSQTLSTYIFFRSSEQKCVS